MIKEKMRGVLRDSQNLKTVFAYSSILKNPLISQSAVQHDNSCTLAVLLPQVQQGH